MKICLEKDRSGKQRKLGDALFEKFFFHWRRLIMCLHEVEVAQKKKSLSITCSVTKFITSDVEVKRLFDTEVH